MRVIKLQGPKIPHHFYPYILVAADSLDILDTLDEKEELAEYETFNLELKEQSATALRELAKTYKVDEETLLVAILMQTTGNFQERKKHAIK